MVGPEDLVAENDAPHPQPLVQPEQSQLRRVEEQAAEARLKAAAARERAATQREAAAEKRMVLWEKGGGGALRDSAQADLELASKDRQEAAANRAAAEADLAHTAAMIPMKQVAIAGQDAVASNATLRREKSTRFTARPQLPSGPRAETESTGLAAIEMSTRVTPRQAEEGAHITKSVATSSVDLGPWRLNKFEAERFTMRSPRAACCRSWVDNPPGPGRSLALAALVSPRLPPSANTARITDAPRRMRHMDRARDLTVGPLLQTLDAMEPLYHARLEQTLDAAPEVGNWAHWHEVMAKHHQAQALLEQAHSTKSTRRRLTRVPLRRYDRFNPLTGTHNTVGQL